MIVSISIVPVVSWMHKRHQAKKRAELIAKSAAWAEELLASYQTDTEARKVLARYFHHSMLSGLDEELTERIKAAYQQILLEDNRAQYLPSLNVIYQQFQSEAHPVKRAELLLQLLARLEQCHTEVLAEFEAETGLSKTTTQEKIGRLIFYTTWELANRESRIRVNVKDE